MFQADTKKQNLSLANAKLRLIVCLVLLFALLLFCLLAYLQANQPKVHLHIPIGLSRSGQAKYLSLICGQNPHELFQFAQSHDLQGQTEMASEDFREILKHPAFAKYPEKLKHVMNELADTRDSLAKSDYFGELLAHSRMCYWRKSQMPIKVYLPPARQADGFSDYDCNLIKDCFQEWCSLVPGRLSYKMVDKAEDADISFSQKTTSLDLSFSRAVLAHTIPMPSGPERWSIFPAGKTRIEPMRPAPEIKSKDDPRASKRKIVLLHEIGHALGLIGHSAHAGDLMFFAGSSGISERDINTFRKLYMEGDVYERAEKSLREQASKNDKYALLKLAIQEEENGTASREKQESAFRTCRKAAELGSDRALVMLGWMYYNGTGCKRSLKQACKCFLEARRRNSPGALMALAAIYERGDGLEADLKEAEKLLKIAVSMDLLRAPVIYGGFLSYQFPSASSFSRAANFYKRSAETSQTDGLYKLALAYEHGQGLEADLKEAEKLRKKAREIVEIMQARTEAEYYARAGSWAECGEYQRASADYGSVIAKKPLALHAYVGRAGANSSLARAEEVIADTNEALKLDPDCVIAYMRRAYGYFALGKMRACLEDVRAVLQRTSKPDGDRVYMLILGALAARSLGAGSQSEADKMLAEAAASAKKDVWPYPVIEFLQNKITKENFARLAIGYSKSTEVKFYLACRQLQENEIKNALENLRWVKEEGDKVFFEYFVSCVLLKRLEKQEAKDKP